MKKIFSFQNILLIFVLGFIFYQLYISLLDGKAYLEEGQSAIISSEYEKAIDFFTQAIEEIDRSNQAMFFSTGMTLDKTKNNVKALQGIGKALIKQKEYEKANMVLTEVLNINAFYPESRMDRAYTYTKLEKYEEAIEDYSFILRSAPNAVHLYNSRGHLYLRTRDYENAVNDFEKIISLLSEKKLYYNHLEILDRLSILFSTYPEDLVRNGERALELADLIFNSMKQIQLTSSAQAHFHDTKALAHAECGQYDLAIDLIQKALKFLEESGSTSPIEKKLNLHLESFKKGTPIRN